MAAIKREAHLPALKHHRVCGVRPNSPHDDDAAVRGSGAKILGSNWPVKQSLEA